MRKLSSYGFKLCIALAIVMIVLTVWMIVALHFNRALVFGLCAACELCGASLFAEVVEDGSRGGRGMKDTETVINDLRREYQKMVSRTCELNNAVNRLNVSKLQRKLMQTQAAAMMAYVDALDARIADLEATHD